VELKETDLEGLKKSELVIIQETYFAGIKETNLVELKETVEVLEANLAVSVLARHV
jgi:hypothetical protein